MDKKTSKTKPTTPKSKTASKMPKEALNGQSFEDLGIDEEALNRAWRQVAEENKRKQK